MMDYVCRPSDPTADATQRVSEPLPFPSVKFPAELPLEERKPFEEPPGRFEHFHHVRFELVMLKVAPRKTQCPDCGWTCRRRQCVKRGPIYDVSLDGLRVLVVTVGVYRCKRPGCERRYFRKALSFAPPRGRYTCRARRLGIDAVKLDGLPFTRAVKRLARELSVNPVRSTLWEWHKAEGDLATDDASLHKWTTESLSGVLCVDELYDGEFCLLMATDPLADLTVGFQLVEKAEVDAAKVAEFLDYLTAIGAKPEVVVTDESKLYPAALNGSTWADVLHQLCNFHFIRLVVKDVVASVRAYAQTMPKDRKRKRGRPKKRGRPRSDHNKKRKEVQDARCLFAANPKNLTDEQTEQLKAIIEVHPALRASRDFAEQVYALFDADDVGQAESIRQLILADERFRVDANLAKSVARLEDEARFRKLVLHLNYENLDRTSNHVERDNRRFRKRQNSHYRLRLDTTIRNALNLKLEEERSAKAGQQIPRLKPRQASQG